MTQLVGSLARVDRYFESWVENIIVEAVPNNSNDHQAEDYSDRDLVVPKVGRWATIGPFGVSHVRLLFVELGWLRTMQHDEFVRGLAHNGEGRAGAGCPLSAERDRKPVNVWFR